MNAPENILLSEISQAPQLNYHVVLLIPVRQSTKSSKGWLAGDNHTDAVQRRRGPGDEGGDEEKGKGNKRGHALHRNLPTSMMGNAGVIHMRQD